MPQPGFESITVKEEIYEKVRKIAKKNHRSPAGQIEFWLENEN
jgi:hypothetical protein